MPWRSQLDMINAMKSFHLELEGPDELTHWFVKTLGLVLTTGVKYGSRIGGSDTMRYVNNEQGMPVFVYVKDGKIIRITPIEFDEGDAEPWTIEARGRKFTPPQNDPVSLCLCLEINRLFSRQAPVPDEKSGFRSRR